MTVLITGVAGFIGSNLAQKLLEKGHTVIGIDNLSRGKDDLLSACHSYNSFSLYTIDLANKEAVTELIPTLKQYGPIDTLWHLAANSDIPGGVADPQVDLKDTFFTTFYSIEIAKQIGIPTFLFASSSAIYGDKKEAAIHEDIGPLMPISNYGAMKLSSEAILYAAAESFLKKLHIFRFPNVVGAPATHGVIFDFINKLSQSKDTLEVLGNGSQQKSYLHVADLIDAMLFIEANAPEKVNYYNIGNSDEGVFVKEIAAMVVEQVNPTANIVFGEGNRGWVGDIPKFFYDTSKLKALGFTPRLSSKEAVKQAIKDILENNAN
jgi:UDP-glucose 4-epimerase